MLPLRPTPRHYRLVFPLLYLGVFVAGAYYEVAGLCGGFSGMRLAVLAGVLAVPLALEWVEQRWSPAHGSRRRGQAMLIARMVLFETVAAADCSGFSKFLYLIVPFTAYFIDRRLSFALAVAYVGLVVARLWLWNPVWYLQANYISDVLIFSIGLAFAIAMAAVASEEEASRRRAEGLLADLERSHERLAAYAEQAGDLAAARERNRLARDMHDSLGHYLAVISVQLEKASAFRQRDAAAADNAVREARGAAREALHEVRQTVGALREMPQVFELTTALTGLVDGLRSDAMRVDLRVDGNEVGYAEPVLLTLYRAAQEGLTNVQKHAQASEAAVTVILGAEAACLTVKDNGRGVDLSRQGDGAQAGHYGWQGMRERVAMLGGTLEVDSALGKGTELRITVPRVAAMARSEPLADGVGR